MQAILARYSLWKNEVEIFDTLDHQELQKKLRSPNNDLGLLHKQGATLFLDGAAFEIKNVCFAVYKTLEPDDNHFHVVVEVEPSEQ